MASFVRQISRVSRNSRFRSGRMFPRRSPRVSIHARNLACPPDIVAPGTAAKMVSYLDASNLRPEMDDVVVKAGILPVDAAMQLLDTLHSSTGLPWWATIVGCTLAVRAMMLPLAIVAVRNSHRMKGMQPELQELQAAGLADSPEGRIQYAERYKALQNKHGVRLHRTFLPILGQMPIFLTMFFTLNEMGSHYPTLVEGGTLWFTDLTLPDPTYQLPVLTSLTFLAVVEAGGEAEAQNQNADQAKMMKHFMRFMSIAMVPLTMGQPCAVFVYWITTNIFSMTQTLTMKLPVVKSALGIVNTSVEKGPISAPQHVIQQQKASLGSVDTSSQETLTTTKGSSHHRPASVRRKRRRRRRS